MDIYKILNIKNNSQLTTNNHDLYIYGNIICNTKTQQLFTNIKHPKELSLIKQFNLNPNFPLTISNHLNKVLYQEYHLPNDIYNWNINFFNKHNLLVKSIGQTPQQNVTYSYDEYNREIKRVYAFGYTAETIYTENNQSKQIITKFPPLILPRS